MRSVAERDESIIQTAGPRIERGSASAVMLKNARKDCLSTPELWGEGGADSTSLGQSCIEKQDQSSVVTRMTIPTALHSNPPTVPTDHIGDDWWHPCAPIKNAAIIHPIARLKLSRYHRFANVMYGINVDALTLTAATARRNISIANESEKPPGNSL